MRNISFALTTQQVENRTKDVTRRIGWKNLKVGERLQACEKCQGLGKGGKIRRLVVIRVKDVRREPLNSLTGKGKPLTQYTDRMAKRECVREGFPDMSPRQFVKMFCEHNGCSRRRMITRIEFEYC